MLLRVRRGTVETFVEGKAALARLYRTRRIGPGDLVWHPARACWVPVEAFLFVERGAAAAESRRDPSRPIHRGGDSEAR